MADARRVVIADPIDAAAIARLRGGPCEVDDVSADPSKLGSVLPHAWAIVVRSRTKVDRALIAAAPQLALIARAGVGVDSVDMTAAGQRGIRVVNAPAAATTSVAELSMTFYLLMVRGVLPKIASTKSGKWERGTSGRELSGRTVGFVGYGRIAREIARRLVPFGANSIAYDPFVHAAVDATEIVTLDDLLARADIVSVHAALTPENHHLLDARAFGRMKTGAFLVNVARGPLVDEAALLDALGSGRVAGAALDVFEEEPPMNHALLEHPHVMATPHLGASTAEAQARAGANVVDEVLRALRGEPLQAEVATTGAPR